jgi:hypothetical protein
MPFALYVTLASGLPIAIDVSSWRSKPPCPILFNHPIAVAGHVPRATKGWLTHVSAMLVASRADDIGPAACCCGHRRRSFTADARRPAWHRA